MAGVSGEVALDLTVKNVGRRSWDLREDDIWAAYADTPTAWTHDQDSNIVGLDLTFGSARTSPALAHDLHLAPGQNKRVSLAIEAGSAGDRVLIYFGSGAGDPAAEWRVTVR